MRNTIIFILILGQNLAFSQGVDKIMETCEEFHLLGQTDSVKKYGKLILKETKNEIEINRTKVFLAHAIQRTFPDSSFKTLNLLQKEFIKSNDNRFLAYLNASLGTYNRKIGNFDQAIKYHEKAMNFAEKHYSKSDDSKLNRIRALQYNSISIIHSEKSDYELSTQIALKALKIANQYHFDHIESGSLIIIGNTQMHFKQLDLAEKSFLSAKKIAEKIKDNYRIGVSISNLGIINLLKLENNFNDSFAYNKAKKYFLEALEIAKSQNDYAAMSARNSNLANVENAAKNYDKAVVFLTESIKYADLSKSKLLKMQVTTTLARNYMELGETKKAIETANTGIILSKELSNEKDIPSLYDILQKAYTKEKDFVKALSYQEAQMNAKDSLYKSSTTDKINELQTKYETEKKQKEIELLTAQNQIKEVKLQQKNYQISLILGSIILLIGGFYFWGKQRNLSQKQEAAEMKQRLLRAQLNPHFLFNCLNSIQRLYVDGKTALANDFIADFAQLMRDILENTSRPKVLIFEEINYIKSYLELEKKRLGNKFEFQINMDDNAGNSEIEVPSFIIQPLVENSLIHGILPKKEKGKIDITVSLLSENEISISVTDNGVGFYSSKKISEGHTSKGIELIKSRLNHKSKLSIKELKDISGKAEGTKIELKITN